MTSKLALLQQDFIILLKKKKKYQLLNIKTFFLLTRGISIMASEATDSKRDLIAKDKRRIDLFLQYREYHKGMAELRRQQENQGNLHEIHMTSKIFQKQNTVTTKDLKNITLSDINFSKDHIRRNCVINFTVFENPTTGLSTALIALDDNNDAERVTIYNLKESLKEIEQMLQIGTSFQLLIPMLD
jgi:hypothetical protein